jgi:hypothetical protein
MILPGKEHGQPLPKLERVFDQGEPLLLFSTTARNKAA